MNDFNRPPGFTSGFSVEICSTIPMLAVEWAATGDSRAVAAIEIPSDSGVFGGFKVEWCLDCLPLCDPRPPSRFPGLRDQYKTFGGNDGFFGTFGLICFETLTRASVLVTNSCNLLPNKNSSGIAFSRVDLIVFSKPGMMKDF